MCPSTGKKDPRLNDLFTQHTREPKTSDVAILGNKSTFCLGLGLRRANYLFRHDSEKLWVQYQLMLLDLLMLLFQLIPSFMLLVL